MATQRRLTCVSGSSAKFWQVSQDGGELVIQFGRIGAAGQQQQKSFDTAQAATEAADRLIAEKLRKGYAPDTAAPDPGVTGPAQAPAVPTADEADEDTFVMPVGWRRVLLPRRGGEPVARKRPEAGAAAKVSTAMGLHEEILKQSLAMPQADPVLVQAATAWLDSPAVDNPIGAAVVVAMLGQYVRYDDNTTLPAVADMWLHEYGTVFAARAVCELGSLWFYGDHGQRVGSQAGILRRLLDTEQVGQWLGMHRSVLTSRVRAAVAAAPDAEYAQVVTALAELREHGLHQRAAASYLVPSEADWVDADCREAVRVNTKFADVLVSAVSTPEQADLIVSHLSRGFGAGIMSLMATVVDGLGPAHAVPLLAHWFDGAYAADAERRMLGMLSELPVDEAMGALLDRVEHRLAQPYLLQAAARFPRRALRLLAERDSKITGGLLRAHVLGHPDLVDEALAAVSPAAAERISAVALAAAQRVEAPAELLPTVLVSPPWTAARTVRKPVVIEGLVCADPATMRWLPGEREQWRARQSHFPSWAAEHGGDWQNVIGNLNDTQTGYSSWYGQIAFFVAGPEELAAPLIGRWRPGDLWDAADWMPSVVARFELAVLPMLLDGARRSAAQHVPLLLPYASPEVAVVMADALARLKSVREIALSWLARQPEAAARALVPPALGKAGVARRQAEQALTVLAANGHRDAVTAGADAYGPAARDAVDALLAEDPLDLLPANMPVLPEWADPGLLEPVQLRGDAGALPRGAVRHLLTMLAVSRAGEPYAGVALVREACDPGSLAEFGWSLFTRWQAVGFPSRDGWVMNALGLVGDDETVRRLAPLIRVWPGEGGHNRAVTGLHVLAAIGSDTALMHLHGIAEKAKFTGLKERARAKMADVAAQLGLTAEQLADRLVPDFGLAADGSLTLDYGRRTFTVGFDEQLKPYVADGDGKRRKELPKPGAADDAALAPAAYQRFAGLKKDVRTVAADTIRRLELAMTARRRWSGEDFTKLLVGHPLLWHIVRRLVWGVYDEAGDLVAAVRVAEDRSFADIDDETVSVAADAVIGVAHPVELADALPGWAEVFADYEILQPFAQLGRAVYGLSEQERQGTVLTRFGDVKIPTGRVVGLERRGWRRGAPQDAGHQGWMERDVPGNRIVMVDLDPGIAVGYIDMFPEQSLERIWVKGPGDGYWHDRSKTTFDVLDPVTASEILRDLEEITR
ncbi:hypothetical protein Cme02nite_04240 [Catellatospora methionotrophica]|uniref:WGR domain-containing protein n=1 Tax=Catellatospora methionotrophica TaxID=121620 RepID=A0A8J3PCJ8_9ACTN|nr:DUF4132 domain-containing protein [Catellatospora methionotrophica]GIG12092.1 hypothetical protein Cme02nite_04240 [Catellatospora methionotrophica]